jgi:hypothetical protein
MKETRINVIGKLRGTNRSQVFIDVLNDKYPNQVFWEYDCHLVMKDKAGIPKRIYQKILRVAKGLFYLLRADKVIYLAMNDMSMWKLLFARMVKKDVIVDFYTSRYYFNCVDVKLSCENDRNKSFVKKIEMIVVDYLKLKTPNKVIFLGDPDILFFGNFFKVNNLSKKSFTVPLVMHDLFNESMYKPSNVKNGCVNVCWWGKASSLHGIEYILSEFEHSCGMANDINLYFFDDCPKRVNYIKKLIKQQSSNIRGFIEINSDLTMKNGLSEWLQCNCHISLGPLGFTAWSTNGLSNKLVESWMLKIPMITQDNKVLDKYHDSCFIIKDKASGELANMLVKVIGDVRGNFAHNIEPVINRGRCIYEKNHSVDAFKNKFEDILDVEL